MAIWYTLAISPEDGEFDYYEVHDMAFANPVQKGDSIEFKGIEMEVENVLHKIGGKSYLYVTSDCKL